MCVKISSKYVHFSGVNCIEMLNAPKLSLLSVNQTNFEVSVSLTGVSTSPVLWNFLLNLKLKIVFLKNRAKFQFFSHIILRILLFVLNPILHKSTSILHIARKKTECWIVFYFELNIYLYQTANGNLRGVCTARSRNKVKVNGGSRCNPSWEEEGSRRQREKKSQREQVCLREKERVGGGGIQIEKRHKRHRKSASKLDIISQETANKSN